MATFMKNPHKVNLEIEGSNQVASMVSLFDLLFVETDTGSIVFRDDPAIEEGIRLSHDLFVYYPGLYTNSGDVATTAISQESWLRYGMDITPVVFDKRAKAKFIEDANFKSRADANGKKGYWIYDKESALYPKGFSDFHETDGLGSANPKPWYSSETALSDFDQVPGIGVGVKDEMSASAVLVVSNRDSVFEQVLTNENLTAYKEIWVNSSNQLTWKIVAYCLGLNIDVNDEGFNAKTVIDFAKQNPEALKNCWVWIRCSFFGDYVMMEDFNQKLDQNSTVQHTNLYLGSKDTKKYDHLNYNVLIDKETDNTERSEKTLPYLPRTAPAIDLLAESLLGDLSSLNTPAKFAQKAIDLSELSDKSALGSLLPSVSRAFANGSSSLEGYKVHLSPPGWFDTEARLEADKYTDNPVIFPKDGNNVGDGRIVNVSIDELWVFLKQTVFGRIADTEASNNKNDVGYISAKGTSATTKDTLPIRARKDSFVDEQGNIKKGDALDYSYNVSDINNTSLFVRKFISSPTVTKISTFDLLKDISKEVIGTESERDISKFRVPVIDKDGNYSAVDKIDETKEQTDGLFSAREVPFSLVELELFMKMNRYNIMKTNLFLKENFAVTGGLGRKARSDSAQDKAAGSLYQLHKDYNYEIDNPNTVLDTTINEFNPTNPKPNAVFQTDNEGDYGSSEELKDSSREFSSAETYLAGDGTWRSIREHSRAVVLTSTEEPY